MEQLEFGILGSTTVRVDGSEQQLPRQLRRVLGALLVNPRRAMTYSRLAEWVWSEDNALPNNLKGTFHTYGRRLRKSFESWGAHARLSTRNEGFVLEVDDSLVDYSVFRRLVSKATSARRSGRHDEALRHVREALALWRGEPLADLDTDYARDWRRSATRLHFLPANELLVDEQIATEQYIDALSHLDELDRDFPGELGLAMRRLRIVCGLSSRTDASAIYLKQHKAFRQAGRDDEAEKLRELYDSLVHETVVAPAPEPTPDATTKRPQVLLHPEVTDFVGRSDLLQELDRLAGVESGEVRGSVVMLSGLGGSGKTTLALRWARTAAERLGIGALVVDLRGHSRTPRRDTAAVVDFFLGRLGYSVEHIIGPTGRAEKLIALLRAEPRVVVLDNAADAAHVRPLLPLFDSCPVVITSRQKLTKLATQYGISPIKVGGLPTSHALALLKKRIRPRAADPVGALEQLAERCHGLPLSLSLAAERANSREVPLSVLVDELRDPEIVLDMGHDDGDDEDPTLRKVFTLTYEGLSPDAGRLFVLLGVLPSGEFGIGAVAALLGENLPAARRAVDRLIGVYFVEQRGEEGRYHIHDLVLAYAESLARTAPESQQARLRLFSYYLHSVANAHRTSFPYDVLPPSPPLTPGVTPVAPVDDAAADRWYRAERDNLGAVVHEAWRWHPEHAWPLVHIAARFMDRFGQYAELVEWLERTATYLDREQRCLEAASTLNDLGYVQLGLGDIAAAAANLARALELVRQVSSPEGELSVQINLARLERKKGNHAGAIAALEKCHDTARKLDDRGRLARTEVYLAEAYQDQGHYQVGAECLYRALESWEALSDVPRQVAALAELCELSRLRGRLEEATAFGARALRLVDDVRGVGEELRLYTVLAMLHLDLRHYEEAVEAARHVVRLAHTNRQPDAEAEALAVLGQVRYAVGEPEEAAGAWVEAVEIFQGRGRGDRAAELRGRIAELNVPLVLDSGDEYRPWSLPDDGTHGKPPHPYR